jgi:hypothetical protein
MTDVDPFAVMRNSATLQAYRARSRAARAAAQPFLHIALGAFALNLLMFLYGFLQHRLASLGLASVIVLGIGGLTFAIAGQKSARYLREHPFDSHRTQARYPS